MEEIFILMAICGGFAFLCFGLCVANSIEAKENKSVEILLTGFSVVGVLFFLIGLIGLIITQIF
jgi:hypothetical protein